MSKNVIIGLVIGTVLVGGGVGFALTQMGNDDETSTASTQQDSTTVATETKEDESSVKLPEQSVGQQPDCSLYSLQDIADIWGVPMTDTDVDGSKVIEISGPQNYQYECDYNETDSGTGLSVSIQYKVYENADAAKTSIKNTRDGAKFGDTVYFVQDEVSDIGDEAFFSLPARQVDNPANVEQQLYARDDNVVYLISATNLEGAKADYRDKILATYRLHL